MIFNRSKKKLCPFLRKPCIESDCAMWVQVQGTHPQTGEMINKWDCSFIWVPVLAVEMSRQQRNTTAAVESERNATANKDQSTRELIAKLAQINGPKLIDG